MDDVLFIQKNYQDYFESLVILPNSEQDTVLFRLILKGGTKPVDVALSRAGYQILDRPESLLIESFEGVLKDLMGPVAFSNMIYSLVSRRITN